MTNVVIFMAALLLVLIVTTYFRAGSEGLSQAFRASGDTGLKFVPVLVIAILMMGFIEVLLPKQVVEHWLSDASGPRGIAIATLAGIATPAGSLVGLPLAAGLAKAGAGAAVIITYLVSFSLLSLIRLPIEVGILGPRLTAMRVLACLLLPPLAGLITLMIAPILRSFSNVSGP
ncbi:putative permease [Enhygromyxa salina]|uniref:Putative permease n=2 Tax=Enhygromyxa salina TaxID=215803 RepID=A0A2S9YU70_9BACT|nr:putative permease [Enhygromyxa salina]